MFSNSQNASAGVRRMLLGNKCDIEAKRKVSNEMGEKVRAVMHTASMWVRVQTRCFISVRYSFPVSCFTACKRITTYHMYNLSIFLLLFFSLKHTFIVLFKKMIFFIIARKGTWYSILRN